MSSREFEKVKWAIEVMLDALVQVTARDLKTYLWQKSIEEPESERWYFWLAEVNRTFGEFTTVIDTLYPGDERKLNDWVQRLDNEVDALEDAEFTENEPR